MQEVAQHYLYEKNESDMFRNISSPGTYAVMSVMIGGVTERLAPDSNFMAWDNETNSTIIDTVTRDAERVRVAAAVTFMSGLFQVNCGVD